MSARTAAVALTALALLAPAAAQAVPPGGPVETPLGATVTITSATVVPGGTVTFSGAGYDPGERVSIKVDDGKVRTAGGGDVFAIVDAGADGTLAGTVDLSTAAPANAEALKSGTHSLRLLSTAVAGARSIHGDFVVQAPAGAGGGGTGGGPGADGTGAGGGTEAGQAPTAPGAPPSPGPDATIPTRAAAITSTGLRAVGGRVAVRLRGGSFSVRGALTVRTATGVTLTRTLRTVLAPRATRTVRLTLTRAGRAYLRRHPRVAVRVRLTPARPGTPTTKSLTLKVAA
jgi:hypothetical protein